MWFQVLGLIIAVALIVKASIALVIPGRFYAARMRQYESESLPPKLLVAPAVVLALTAVAWYATFFHHRPWGFIVTAVLTAVACMAVHHLLRWKSHRQSMHAVVRDPRVWRIDCALLLIGVGFLSLAMFVY